VTDKDKDEQMSSDHIHSDATKQPEPIRTREVSPVEGAGVSPGPVPVPDWSHDDPDHPGFVVSGIDNTPGHKAYYIHLEAKPGQEDALQKFLADINAGVDQEPLTGPWFALRYSQTTFGIFEAFPDANARHTHDNGPGGRNFLRSELLHEMLAHPAQLYPLDVLHGKFNVVLGHEVTPA
jgi:quinol monooxygenase YgiN